MDGWMDGWIDGWVGEQTACHLIRLDTYHTSHTAWHNIFVSSLPGLCSKFCGHRGDSRETSPCIL